MIPFIKYLPHLGVTALIIFLSVDYFSPNQRTMLSASNTAKTHTKEEGSHGNNEEIASHSQEERRSRMGIYHYNEGNKFYKDGNFTEAIIRYEKALNHNKGFQEAIINLSTAYMKNKMFDQALGTLQAGQKQFPQVALIDYNLACYFSMTENLEPSLSALKKAIKKGYNQFTQIESDPDLYNLRQSSEYKTWKKDFPFPTKT
jgi:tetratricopeptide (TPR) repeat protein